MMLIYCVPLDSNPETAMLSMSRDEEAISVGSDTMNVLQEIGLLQNVTHRHAHKRPLLTRFHFANKRYILQNPHINPN